MAMFMIINRHRPEECEAGFKAYEEVKDKLNPAIKGATYYCPCPFGEHASWTPVEASSAEEALGYLWPEEREHSRAIQVETIQI
ncbi:MAG: hypothetical protein ABR548_00510 [Actinomycetota bacterium]|nr:hypothetical protein [Actinomycetota bacterium]